MKSDSSPSDISNLSLEQKIQVLAQNSILLKKKSDSAKTKVKKNYYLKKLKKNNQRIATYLGYIDKHQQSQEDAR